MSRQKWQASDVHLYVSVWRVLKLDGGIYPSFGQGNSCVALTRAFASNLIPHAESPSEFYTRAIETVRKICDVNQIVVPSVLKARSVYEKLQMAKFLPRDAMHPRY